MTYPDKPDERLLAHFEKNRVALRNSPSVQEYLLTLGFYWYGDADICNRKVRFVVSQYVTLGAKDRTREHIYRLNDTGGYRVINLYQLKAEVAEVLGTPVPTEPVEKPLSRRRFVSYVNRISIIEAELSELALRQLAIQEERKDLHRILSNSGMVNTHLDESGDLDGYEWSDDGFKTYTGRKV